MNKSFGRPSQFTKVKKGSNDLQNKQASSFQKVDVLKNSEKVPNSKSSFYNQLIKYSLFLVSFRRIINTEERILTESVCSYFQTHLPLFISRVCRSAHPSLVNQCFLNNKPIILCFTYFHFHRTVSSKKYLEEFDGKSIF